MLPVGHGDTQPVHARPVVPAARLPNGVYFIEVTANPRANLAEPDTTNNTAYRRIRLSGTRDDRQATVFAKGLVTRN